VLAESLTHKIGRAVKILQFPWKYPLFFEETERPLNSALKPFSRKCRD
jgi:hypothetical protein